MGLGGGNSTGTALPPHHGHHPHHHPHHPSLQPPSYLLNGHDKEFKNAFEKYKSCSSSPTYGSKHMDTHSEDEDERVDIMDDDDDAMTSSSLNGGGTSGGTLGGQNGNEADFHHKLFGLDHTKQTSVDLKSKSGM